tara:strand:+ start:1189 stop:1620 length:432 start_codon:yes stop_codon:yes gene_type:complete
MGRVTVHLHGRPRGLGTKDLIENYGKRISSSGIDIEIHSDKVSTSEYQDRIENRSGKLILLDESGNQFTSLEIASLLSDVAISGENLIFAIGPVDGFSEEFKSRHRTISISRMTLTHEMASAILLEQLYRASEINKGSSYHRV